MKSLVCEICHQRQHETKNLLDLYQPIRNIHDKGFDSESLIHTLNQVKQDINTKFNISPVMKSVIRRLKRGDGILLLLISILQ